MFASNLSVLAPKLPARSSSAATSYYIQRRTALFALVASGCSTAGLIIQCVTDLLKGTPDRIWSLVSASLLVSSLAMLGLWGYCRGSARPLKLIRAVELVAVSLGLFTASLGLRVSTPDLVASAAMFGRTHPLLAGADPGLLRLLLELVGLMTTLLVATQILALRAALVPSSLRHSLALAACSGLPCIVAVGAGWPAILPVAPLAPEERGFLVTFGANWWLFTAAACAVIARIVHRLESEVQVARRLGQYEVGEKLGEGGMGVVYRARHALMKRPVAIKLLPPEAAGEDAIARFEREVLLTSQLNHPNTVVIHDYGHTREGVFYYVMELIEGATLEQVVEATGPMPSGRVVHVLRMVAGALAEAHERGLVHRDIKPANLLIGPRGGDPDVVKVLDFGLVRPVEAQVTVTCAGAMMGTPLFMSPEAIRSSAGVDARSDLYSLGAVAYYLVSGRHVFQAESGMEVCASHLHEQPAPLHAHVPGIDPDLDRLVLACLAKDPAQRPASARQLLERLERCPSAVEWTRAQAEAWWAEHQFLLRAHSPAPSALSPTAIATAPPQRAAG